MGLIVENIQWIMLAAGLLTLSLAQAIVAPRAAMRTLFGEETDGAGVLLAVRSWGLVVSLTALFLLYAAFVAPAYRPAALILSGVGKLHFVTMVFSHGVRFAQGQAFLAAIIDAIIVSLFALYLVATLT
ncbi:MAG: hypothetical protein GC206_04715 [Alphaproteobacteria bacterium]|nr:hypothetical protein [Alphaproteobacteria bacterium]